LLGIVFNPVNGELFTALRGQGARLNDAPIVVSNTATIEDSLLVTGFPYSIRTAPTDQPIARFTSCLTAAQGVRRLGSAALDLCYVACGRFEGFWEENLKPWDTAAGALIVQEAGGMVSDFESQPFRLDKNQILATNSHIHQEMIQLLYLEDCA
jgi:myo-inositol-1(or 4)-monophosphatase